MKKPRFVSFTIDLADLMFEETRRVAIEKLLSDMGAWARRKCKWGLTLEAKGSCPSFDSGPLDEAIVTLAEEPARIAQLLPHIVEQIKTGIELEEIHSMPLTFKTKR